MNNVMEQDIKKVLVSEEEIREKVAEIGARISEDYAGKNLLMVGILKGSVVFMADLMRAVTAHARIDFGIQLWQRHKKFRCGENRQGSGQ